MKEIESELSSNLKISSLGSLNLLIISTGEAKSPRIFKTIIPMKEVKTTFKYESIIKSYLASQLNSLGLQILFLDQKNSQIITIKDAFRCFKTTAILLKKLKLRIDNYK